MIVTRDNLSKVLAEIESVPVKGFDTETTGLNWHKGDRLFSAVVTIHEHRSFYFNFNDNADIPYDAILPRDCIEDLGYALKGMLFIHRAKFDMHMMANEGVDLTHSRYKIHCTQAIGRINYNDHMKYNLDFLAKHDLGISKDDKVKIYCDKHKLFSYVEIEGKREKQYHYDKVPWELIVPYTIQDGRIVYLLGQQQIQSIHQQAAVFNSNPTRSPIRVMEMERELTKVFFKMERVGVKVNVPFTRRALEDQKRKDLELREEFQKLTGKAFVDSGKQFAEIFDEKGYQYPKTEKGNPSFDEDALKVMNNPISEIIQKIRGGKKSQEYFKNFLFFMSKDENIHASFNQGGTGTGRISVQDPNLQNLTKVEKDDSRFNDEYLVRRCLQPRKNFTFFMLDYDQMEYRMMIDYAKEMGLIEKVLGGMDVHLATGEMMGASRKDAKTINFMLLYGGGIAKLCMALYKPTLAEKPLKDLAYLMFVNGMSVTQLLANKGAVVKGKWGDEKYQIPHNAEVINHNAGELQKAYEKRNLYKSKLPCVDAFIADVIKTAKERGFIFNWLGRKSHFKKQFSYSAPNYLIQGGCADVVKLAMIECDKLLIGKKSRMLIQVHDELIFEIHDDEYFLVPELKKIMENVYKAKYLPLTCGVEFSKVSWQEKQDYNEPEARDGISSKDNEKVEETHAGGVL